MPTVSDEKKPATGAEAAANATSAKSGNGSTTADQAGDGANVGLSAPELAALRKQAAERDEFLGLLQRTQADFQNYQKRSQRDREQERLSFVGSIIRDLLPVLDNLERALTEARRVGETGPLVKGVEMVLRQFLDLLGRHGVTRIAAEGAHFDPTIHEALTQQPSDRQPPNTVLHVVEAGYKLNERLLRPAKVVVSAGPPA
jgi:molecular chaperone GrpE